MKSVLAIAGVSVVGMAVGAVMVGLGQPTPETKQKPVGPIVMAKGAALESLAFLKGTWSGNVGEDWVEETWSCAHGDSIIGMFRWQGGGVGGKTTMWELLSIKEEAGKAVLRLRHFDDKFEAWKSEAGPVEAMPAAEVSSNRVLFVAEKGGLKSVEYKSPKTGALEITVKFREEGREAIEMDLKKQ